VLLLFITPQGLHHLVVVLTQHELAEEPDDLLAAALRHGAEALSLETKHFASAYLISHGALKLFLTVNLLRDRLWAFPLALVVLTVFAIIQSVRFSRTHSLVLLALTMVDLAVMALIFWEYRARLLRAEPGA